MSRQKSKKAFAVGRKAWKAPAFARLEAGSAETGPSSNEDGEFTAS